jgi:anti-sigma B factor antagonist
MDFAVEHSGDIAIVTLPLDELDASNAGDLKRDAGPLLERETKLVFDLSRLRFVDSSGLGAFLSCLRKVNTKGGDLKLCGMSTHVRSVFELVRMHRIFDIHETRDAAVKAFGQSLAHGNPHAA